MRPLVDSVLFTFSRLSLFPVPIFTVAVQDSEVQFAPLVRPPNRNIRRLVQKRAGFHG